ncbi:MULTISPECIES: transglycosylase family protein [unclassified Streptomyces]|nr:MULTISPECIES: transglycosylase family protein [unclassified Streptomyces]NEA01817.1 transglycosylase domain-containing protein [Streptomyces sp. SID10116]MYY85398.1 transglycosylase domain-containing protein [Streptomyces sp. SID335]MYZ18316.1 transglycosylase domain-containing protein [Streptomyces sp. SID337]NDZ87820.1 transglycosylase domain-containing protein [Streptomyces sp. SID10115]NEB48952.1 transglycosylase domain-containing protein [Streptomyces sp. SID339]
MLSGHGRHRRPRQAPALIVAAGVTGSAIAIPLLGATSANAAETTTWEKLAQCESGGEWSANPGNGYYGGLQLSQETWEAYGGLDYAPSADQASRSQQIAVAEQVLDAKGTAAWPSCAPIAGLTQDGAAADVDPGAPITPKPTEPSGSTGSAKDDEKGDKGDKGSAGKEKGEGDSEDGSEDKPSDTASDPDKPSGDASDTPGSGKDSREKNHDESGEKGGKGDADADTGDSGKSGDSDATSPTPENATDPADDADGSNGTPGDSASGRHRGDRADESDRADGGSGRHASRGEKRSAKVPDGTYTVRSGDNLSVIADDLGVDGGWHELYTENKKTVGKDPDLILPGQSLDLG